MARMAKNVVRDLRSKGKKIGLIRPISLWPFPENIFRQLVERRTRSKMLVIEMSYGQLVEDVKLACQGRVAVEFLGRAGGGIPTEEEIKRAVSA
jgi:2-oxoglutarate ferredoxin oxidoreductase subunit alpha